MVLVEDVSQYCEHGFEHLRNLVGFTFSNKTQFPILQPALLPPCNWATVMVLVADVGIYCELGFVNSLNLAFFYFATLCGSQSLNQRFYPYVIK